MNGSTKIDVRPVLIGALFVMDICSNNVCPSVHDVRICPDDWKTAEVVCISRPPLLLLAQIAFPLGIVCHFWTSFAHDFGCSATRPRFLMLNTLCSLTCIVGTGISLCLTTIDTRRQLDILQNWLGGLSILMLLASYALLRWCRQPNGEPPSLKCTLLSNHETNFTKN